MHSLTYRESLNSQLQTTRRFSIQHSVPFQITIELFIYYICMQVCVYACCLFYIYYNSRLFGFVFNLFSRFLPAYACDKKECNFKLQIGFFSTAFAYEYFSYMYTYGFYYIYMYMYIFAIHSHHKHTRTSNRYYVYAVKLFTNDKPKVHKSR